MGFDVFKTISLKWWQTGMFKWSLLALGLLIGSTWPEIFVPWRMALCAIFVVFTGYITFVWWKQ